MIIGLGWFALLPRLDLAGQEDKDKISSINALLDHAAEKASATHTFQKIILIPGQNYIQWEKHALELPSILSRGEVNGIEITGVQSAFAVYPAGHMDELNLFLANGQQLRSRPLLREILVVDE